MDKINDFLNHKLPENFLYDDDFVMEKLAKCIDKLANFKLESGNSLLEAAPANELPNVPFGDFKAIDYELMYTRNNSLKRDENNNRDEQLKQLARSRLEMEKKNRDERRKKRREEKEKQRLAAMSTSERQLDDRLMKLNNNGTATKDSDDSDDDSDLAASNDDDSDDDDDDLNPSKLSEYDDDKMDKESLLSNLTRQSSLQKSLNDVQSQSSMEVFNTVNRHAPADRTTNSSSLNKNSKSSFSNSSFMNQTSDYENLNSKPPVVGSPNTTHTYNSNSLQYQGSYNKPAKSTSVLSTTNVPKTTSSTALSALSPKSTFPSSQSCINPTAAIISNPPLSPPYKQTTNNQNVASIRTNPDYYLNPNTASSRFVITKMSEYVRSPHGIYTRVNVPPTGSYAANRSPSYRPASSIPQSTSTVVINSAVSATAASFNPINSQNGDGGFHNGTTSSSSNGNKRAASLRSIQKHHYTGDSNSSYAGVSAGAPITGHSLFTPTKLQLENHSLRIANIQSQQLKSKQADKTTPHPTTVNSSSMTVISQAPNHRNSLKSSHHHHNNHHHHNHGHNNHHHHHPHPHNHHHQQQQQPLNQHFNGLEIAPNYQGTTANKSLNTSKFTNVNYDSQDLIEQYDYI